MTTLALKSYQQAALNTLAAFARAAQQKGPAMAFGELVGRPYNPDPFGEVPCVCLRIPTGGGKTRLATSKGHFYPDFVAELLDGRLAVIEYKGAHLVNDPYEIEKRQVGELWAHKSQRRCLFGQITKDRNGVGTAGQLDKVLT